MQVPILAAFSVGAVGEFASGNSGNPWGYKESHRLKKVGVKPTLLYPSSTEEQCKCLPHLSLPNLETGLEAAENKWTVVQFSAPYADLLLLLYVMNKLTYTKCFTCQRVI